MTLRNFLETCRIGRGRLLIATDSDGDYGLNNMNSGWYWDCSDGNWNLSSASELDGLRCCSDELREALLDAEIIEIDAHVDNKEQNELFRKFGDQEENMGYVCIIVDSTDNDVALLEKENFEPEDEEEWYEEEPHFFMKQHQEWPCYSLTKKEYKTILDIWNTTYSVDGATCCLRNYNREFVNEIVKHGLEYYSEKKVSLRWVNEGLKKLAAVSKEEKSDKNFKSYKRIQDQIYVAVLNYNTYKSAKAIEFNHQKFIDFCVITGNGESPEGIYAAEYLLDDLNDEE